ncbi:TonB-dependent receptor plug domain-containing protein [Catalinimonas alkaloidigena]|nr:TonB-dependent receptor plug domain-containing protein [Catalinimonas alkaloidigena]
MKKRNTLLTIVGLGALVLNATPGYGQEQNNADLFEMSLEELMNVEIVSASKKSENVFNAPVSSYSITREEIARSGASSIPEALRLCPGVIVRETSNGNYDVHLRGLDNTAQYTRTLEQQNRLTLVMIDNRPVFNYDQGGTFWESLPIDLIDIERIEVVRGAVAPLFGPNAVTGVINIITRTPDQKGPHAVANAQIAPGQTQVANLAVGYGLNEKLHVTLSGNYQKRDRFDDLYYFYQSDTFSSDLSEVPDAALFYPDPSLAQNKYGINAFVNYEANDQVSLDLSAGLQDAESQKVYVSSLTPLGTNGISSKYLNLASRVYGVGTRVSYNTGYSFVDHEGGIEYNFRTADAVVDYRWQLSDRLSVRPEFNYQHIEYDQLNTTSQINTYAGSVQVDYQLLDNWRLMGAGRVDKFDILKDAYFSYQLLSTYKLSEKSLLRFGQSRSTSGAFWTPTSINYSITNDMAFNGPGSGPFYTYNLSGNRNLKLASVTLTELGFRTHLSRNLSLDVDAFRQKLRDMNMFVMTEMTYQPTGYPAPYPAYVPERIQFSFENLPLTATQLGLTVSANYIASAKFQFKPFVTIQRTQVIDIPRGANTLPVDSASNPYNIYNGFDDEHKSTPAVFGGLYANFSPSQKWNINLNGYFFSAHTQFHQYDLERESTVGAISGKVLINSKVAYQVIEPLQVYLNVRNLTGSTSREYYGSDRTSRSVMFGASYNF